MMGLLGKGLRKLKRDGVSDTMFAAADYSQNYRVQQSVCLAHWKVLQRDGEGLILKDIVGNGGFAFPHFQARKRRERENWERLRNYYFEGGFVAVEPGDVVFDVGAYIGITSMIAAETAEMVYAIEPSPRARRCLEYNTSEYDNITVLPYAAWNCSEDMDFQYGLKASEDGLIEPDDGGSGHSVTVQAHTVATIAEMVGVDQIDFLKVEAEGVEPEVVEGIGDLDVERVSSTGNAERHGETTYESVAEKLNGRGYDVSVNPAHPYKMVYGRRGP